MKNFLLVIVMMTGALVNSQAQNIDTLLAISIAEKFSENTSFHGAGSVGFDPDTLTFYANKAGMEREFFARHVMLGNHCLQALDIWKEVKPLIPSNGLVAESIVDSLAEKRGCDTFTYLYYVQWGHDLEIQIFLAEAKTFFNEVEGKINAGKIQCEKAISYLQGKAVSSQEELSLIKLHFWRIVAECRKNSHHYDKINAAPPEEEHRP